MDSAALGGPLLFTGAHCAPLWRMWWSFMCACPLIQTQQTRWPHSTWSDFPISRCSFLQRQRKEREGKRWNNSHERKQAWPWTTKSIVPVFLITYLDADDCWEKISTLWGLAIVFRPCAVPQQILPKLSEVRPSCVCVLQQREPELPWIMDKAMSRHFHKCRQNSVGTAETWNSLCLSSSTNCHEIFQLMTSFQRLHPFPMTVMWIHWLKL